MVPARANAAPGVLAHGDRRRGSSACCGGRRARVGEHRRHVVRVAVETRLSLQLADAGVSLSLRESVNSGVMTFFFFFVVRLEARREFDLGDLREQRRLAFARAGRNQRQVRERKGDHIQAGDAEGSSLSRGRSARSSVTPDPHSARQRV